MTCVRHDLAITSPVAPFLLFSLIKCGGVVLMLTPQPD